MDKVWRVRDKNKRKNTTKGKARVDKVEGEELLEAYWRLREEIGIKTYLHGLMDDAKTLKLRFCAGDLDLPKINYTEEYR